MPDKPRESVREVALTFLRLGATAFGGPAAHIGIFRHELVERKQWLDDDQFLDLLGATNLIPGPNSTEMAIHLGYVRAGWIGLIAAGVCFIAPAFLMVLALAALYVHFGTTPTANALLYGIKPVIIAVVANAVYMLLPKAFKNRLLWLTGFAVVMLYFFGVDELALLFGAGAAYVLIRRWLETRTLALIAFLPLPGLVPLAQTFIPISLGTLFLTFLKLGGLLYGSGYVLLAFLRGDFVDSYGWITSQQLLDAVAIGQFTPGPLSTTATFIGYLVADVPGAIVATAGIFLPSFVFVAISSPLIPRMRRSKLFSALLDGVNAAAVGLMASVTVELGIAAIVDPLTAGLAIGALVLLVRFKVNATIVILAGGLIGVIASAIGLVSI
ncbi:MAG: chromate efflux transporter [Chloroflexi bacterium]|jgi:chromate transporter|nr:Chromate transport protein [Anaerolineae bacterium]MCC6567460.1 chromate efflux transporter [Chloroflexota bacterium]MCO6444618.1 chromate efflux transporter [Anaerolineae bacterium]OQY86632.1 MAG: chromate transporter [Anaerolineae bacterium UTCFX5]RIK21509.1 MAG: chromate transporter [Chloroflexota bacterium]